MCHATLLLLPTHDCVSLALLRRVVWSACAHAPILNSRRFGYLLDCMLVRGSRRERERSSQWTCYGPGWGLDGPNGAQGTRLHFLFLQLACLLTSLLCFACDRVVVKYVGFSDFLHWMPSLLCAILTQRLMLLFLSWLCLAMQFAINFVFFGGVSSILVAVKRPIMSPNKSLIILDSPESVSRKAVNQRGKDFALPAVLFHAASNDRKLQFVVQIFMFVVCKRSVCSWRKMNLGIWA